MTDDTTSQMKRITIGLRFPFSTCNDDEKDVFLMSYNDAMKSEFLATLLENDFEDKTYIESDIYHEITIPFELYRAIRYCDIKKLIRYWKGQDVYYMEQNGLYCQQDIARLSRALLLSLKLDFVNQLDMDYPTDEMIRSTQKQGNELRELRETVSNLRMQLEIQNEQGNHNII
jgi:hypothetical protein